MGKGDLKDVNRRLDMLEKAHRGLIKEINAVNDGLGRDLYRRFSILEKQLAKLEKHAYGRLSESSVKAEQKRAERDLMAYVDQAMKKFDKKRG